MTGIGNFCEVITFLLQYLLLLGLTFRSFVASQVFDGFVAWYMVNFNHCSMFVCYCEGMRRVVLNCQGRVSQGAKVRLLSQEMVFGFGWLHGLVNGFQYSFLYQCGNWGLWSLGEVITSVIGVVNKS